jgi:RNA recognition motif-containing protein
MPNSRFAYATYVSVSDASRAIAELNGTELNGSKVIVEQSNAKKTRSAPTGVRETLDDTVIVRNLPRSLDEEAVRVAFTPCGAVKSAVRNNQITRITFEEPSSAGRAILLSGTELQGQVIEVAMAYKPLERAPRPARAAAPAPAPRQDAPAGRKRAPARPRRAPASDNSHRVRIEGITASTTAETLQAHFAPIGAVARSSVSKDNTVGFVLFTSQEDAERAVETLDGSILQGAPLKVLLASQAPSPSRAAAPAGSSSGSGEGAKREPPASLASTIWVAGIQRSHTREVVQASFEKYGEIEKITLSGPTVYVKFASVESADKALAAGGDNALPDGPAVRVEKARAIRLRSSRYRSSTKPQQE